METILSDLNKFEKLSISNGTLNFSNHHNKTLTITLTDLKNQIVCQTNNLTNLKQSEVDQEFYLDFLKYIKRLLMFVHHLDL